MKSLSLLFVLLLSVFSWGNEKVIVISYIPTVDSIEVMEYSVNEDHATLWKRYTDSEFVLLKDSVLVLYSWNKKSMLFKMNIEKLNAWEYVFETPFFGGNGVAVNSGRYVVWGKNDTEVDCLNERKDFFLFDLLKRKHISISVNRKSSQKVSQNLKNIKLLYYDAKPRGAGVKESSVLINVFDLSSWKVHTIKRFPGLSNIYQLGKEYPFWGVGQWLSPDVVSYMTIEMTADNKPILRFYKCDMQRISHASLLASFEFPYSCINLDYQIIDGKIYLMNIDGIYVFAEDGILKNIYKQSRGNIQGFEVESYY